MSGRQLTIELILSWADEHHEATGRWPRVRSGPVHTEPTETWRSIGDALYKGHRGLPGGDTLPRLLARERGARNPADLPMLTEEQILAWARAHHAATGDWPVAESIPVLTAEGEEWCAIDGCLRGGYRGLPGGDSLAKLLARRLGVRNRTNLPSLTLAEVFTWADLHKARTGRWPGRTSASEGLPAGETWVAIDASLREGFRGLPGGTTLSRLLRERVLAGKATRKRPSPSRSTNGRALGGPVL